MESKVIVIDWGIFLHRSIFASKKNTAVPPTFTAMSMILGNLKKIGVNKEDIVIVAVDFLKSWRKEIIEEYKANRKQIREDSGIDFPYWYKKFNELLEEIDIGTNWHIIQIPHLEADDIMAVASRYYKDKEVVLLTYDKDLEQCWQYENVKIFSPLTKKWKLRPPQFNAYKLIASKTNYEASDNLVSPVLNEEEYDKRKMCVDLLKLPDWVESSVIKKLDKIQSKGEYSDQISFNTIRNRYVSLTTDKSKIIDYNKQLEKSQKKKMKKKK